MKSWDKSHTCKHENVLCLLTKIDITLVRMGSKRKHHTFGEWFKESENGRISVKIKESHSPCTFNQKLKSRGFIILKKIRRPLWSKYIGTTIHESNMKRNKTANDTTAWWWWWWCDDKMIIDTFNRPKNDNFRFLYT